MATAVAVTAALVAACCFALASLLQQREASSAGPASAPRPGLLLTLLRRPAWLAGVALAAFSYLVQGAALAFGPLVLVLPIASTDLLFALPLLARQHRTRLTGAEIAGAACIAAGVAAFLLALPRAPGTARPSAASWLPVFLATGVLAGAGVLAGIRSSGPRRAGLYAAAAALLFALLDSLTKSAADLFHDQGGQALAHWEPYALLPAGVLGLLLAQSAFQAGSLAVSLPLIDTIEPVGSVLIGAAVFHEPLAATSGGIALQVTGALLAVTGIVVLDRSPLVRAR